MPLVRAHTTLMLPEAIVIESLLEAHGIDFVTTGKNIVFQCPHLAVLFDGISIFVANEDLATARTLIADADEVPGYLSLESTNFERRPLRNGFLALVMALMGAPFPFWYRGTHLRVDD